jgi:hypothetical protein
MWHRLLGTEMRQPPKRRTTISGLAVYMYEAKDVGGGGRRQGRNVPALLPATDTLAAGVVDESLPSVGRHEGDNCNGGEGEAARRKERT